MNRGDFDGVGYPVLDSKEEVVLSHGTFLYGTVTYVTERGMMVVLATHRRGRGTIVRKHKRVSYLKAWEEISPPRKMLAGGGKVVHITAGGREWRCPMRYTKQEET